MKKQTNRNLLIASSVTLALAMAVWFPVRSRSAGPAGEKMMTEGKMMEHCKMMQEHHQKMMTEMKAQDAALTEQVAKMNGAPDDKKVGLMAAVVTTLAEQRTGMNARMEKMHGEMMTHMMEHMQMGKESMMECPMMKGMKGMGEKSEGDHKEHHEEK